MKKLLLSVLTGIAVIGSASAAPSPSDRKALCERYPDRYVWVEKDEFCVPINPCESGNDAIRRAYCSNTIVLPYDIEKRDMIIDRYLNKVMHAAVSEVVKISGDVVGIKTNDGGYIAFMQGSTANQSDCLMNLMYAMAAYGYGLSGDIWQQGGVGETHFFGPLNNVSPDTLNDIADFASLLQGGVITYDREASSKTYNDLRGAVFVCPNE